MAFWKNLRYVFSDEFSSWIHFVVNSYNQKTEKNEKNLNEMSRQLQQVADKQGVLENILNDSKQEVKEGRAGIEKAVSQCEAVITQCEAIFSEISRPKEEPEITRECLEQMIGEALTKQSAESMQRSQILSARIREVYALIEAQNAKDEDEPDVNELLGRIDALEKENMEYKNRLNSLRSELEEAKDAYLAVEKSYKEEKRRTFDLSKRLVQADDKINDLLVRVKDKDLESMLIKEENDNPFVLTANKDKFQITAANVQVMITRFADTAVIDRFFEPVPDHDPYKKMYFRYQKNIRAAAAKAAQGMEIGQILQSFLDVVQEDLVNKIIGSIYRRMKSANAEFEEKLLAAVNRYMENIGFYCRSDLKEGELLKDEDLKDMECQRDERTSGKQHGEIVEIELFPYYINYVDRGGRRRKVHTTGSMTVIA